MQVGHSFFDVGAASGLFAICASKNGARTVAVEPSREWLPVLKRNLILNSASVAVEPKALSLTAEVVKWEVAVTGINFQGEIPQGTISTVTLVGLLEHYAHHDLRVRIKMDIEGIEFLVLQDKLTLEALERHDAEMFVSFHPGFVYAGWHLKAKALVNRARGVYDGYRLFNAVAKYAKVRLPTGSRINSALRFAALLRFGCHDFILSFGEN